MQLLICSRVNLRLGSQMNRFLDNWWVMSWFIWISLSLGKIRCEVNLMNVISFYRNLSIYQWVLLNWCLPDFKGLGASFHPFISFPWDFIKLESDLLLHSGIIRFVPSLWEFKILKQNMWKLETVAFCSKRSVRLDIVINVLFQRKPVYIMEIGVSFLISTSAINSKYATLWQARFISTELYLQ